MNNETLTERSRRLRERFGLSAYAFGPLIGYDREWYYSVERSGKVRNPSLEPLLDLLEHYGEEALRILERKNDERTFRRKDDQRDSG